MQPQGLEAFPFPKAPANDRTAIAELAQHCLDKRGVGCEALEAEIDADGDVDRMDEHPA